MYNQDQILNKIQDRLEKVEEETSNFRGRAIVQGYGGKRFDLNDNLNVIFLFKRLRKIEDDLLTVFLSLSQISPATLNGFPEYGFDEYSDPTHIQDGTKSCCCCTAATNSVLTMVPSTGTGLLYHYVNIGTGDMTLQPPSGTIMGESSMVLRPNESIDLTDKEEGKFIW